MEHFESTMMSRLMKIIHSRITPVRAIKHSLTEPYMLDKPEKHQKNPC